MTHAACGRDAAPTGAMPSLPLPFAHAVPQGVCGAGDNFCKEGHCARGACLGAATVPESLPSAVLNRGRARALAAQDNPEVVQGELAVLGAVHAGAHASAVALDMRHCSVPHGQRTQEALCPRPSPSLPLRRCSPGGCQVDVHPGAAGRHRPVGRRPARRRGGGRQRRRLLRRLLRAARLRRLHLCSRVGNVLPQGAHGLGGPARQEGPAVVDGAGCAHAHSRHHRHHHT